MSKVACRKIDNSISKAVEEVMALAEYERYITGKVALKINLCWDRFLPGVQTSPTFLDAVLTKLSDYDLIVIESETVTTKLTTALRTTKIDKVIKKHEVEFVNLSEDSMKKVNTRVGTMHLPETLLSIDSLVTLPVLKTHCLTTITCSLKNQWGCISELRHNMHLVVDEALVEVNKIVKPCFAILDGTIGLEGCGPKMGTPFEYGYVFASSDLVSLDSCAAQSLGFNPKNINHLCVAQREDVGEMDFELIGDSPLVYHAKPAEKPFSTEVEFFLRKHFPKIFDSFMMDFLAWSAARYYDVWYYSKGRRLLRQFMEESKFAYQWKED